MWEQPAYQTIYFYLHVLEQNEVTVPNFLSLREYLHSDLVSRLASLRVLVDKIEKITTFTYQIINHDRFFSYWFCLHLLLLKDRRIPAYLKIEVVRRKGHSGREYA